MISVSEGRVQLNSGSESADGADLMPKSARTPLLAGQQAIYSSESRTVTIGEINATDVASWRNGVLKYMHEPLGSVARGPESISQQAHRHQRCALERHALHRHGVQLAHRRYAQGARERLPAAGSGARRRHRTGSRVTRRVTASSEAFRKYISVITTRDPIRATRIGRDGESGDG